MRALHDISSSSRLAKRETSIANTLWAQSGLFFKFHFVMMPLPKEAIHQTFLNEEITMNREMNWKPLAISICCACALTACGGGGGDDSPADKPIPNNPGPSIPNTNNQMPNVTDNQKPSGVEGWRRIDGFKKVQTKDEAFREYSENLETVVNGVRHPEDVNLKAYYFSGGDGLHHAKTPGGGAVDYYNMSYATFGNYKRLVNDLDDVFYVAKYTPIDKIPISGMANYNGPVLYRGAIDGNISLNVDFSTRDIKGKVEGSSLYDKETMNIKAQGHDGPTIFGGYNIIGGELHSNVARSKVWGHINAAFAGPNAEQIVGTLSRSDYRSENNNTEASFGATRQ